ncbi:hypothetical protein Gdia_2497 [Gluconacetobacter diazotrophicus PA1 5]|uniref:hypothetical protein n=1 Tax=Gluconacetobacter diazotrophicus TaxID=33996 RepID=UPI000173D953|nr:hypothetical protein [Gluconacetobacter diazotrophicus]ACI52241.1 hypothetical protein Gdia_2497 [Gluconacetobacter diazotrophicus PA1 5]TWB00403.1 hypothetical protein FBZ86_13717 [Gluconacetobacter diazotrophicus]
MSDPCACMGWPVDIIWRDRARCVVSAHRCTRCGASWGADSAADRPISNLDLSRRESKAIKQGDAP